MDGVMKHVPGPRRHETLKNHEEEKQKTDVSLLCLCGLCGLCG